MRLLQLQDDGACRLVKFVGRNVPPYAILSHTWGLDQDEVNFQDIEHGTATHKPGYAKVQFCGTQALNDGLQYFWVDTCCIDKSSSAELSEALNSMFRWYKAAAKCYVYLSDIRTENNFCQSRWFTRGWTLQELLAPSSVEFFSCDGEYIGDKKSLEWQIQETTNIALGALRGRPLSESTVAERMSWGARRETTLEEDRVYCLLGIFDTYMPVLYGEGAAHAMRRLQKEIAISASQPLLDDLSLQEKTNACLASLTAVDQTRFISQTLHRSKHACSWVPKHPQYSAWLESNRSSLLWVVANAGCGKSTVAAHISQMVRTDKTSVGKELAREVTRCFVLSFFFRNSSQGSDNTALAALRTMTSQLAGQEPNVRSILLKRFEMLSVKGAFEWPWDNLAVVFSEMLDSVPPTSQVYIIIDAVDECESDSISLALLLEWLKNLTHDPPTASESRSAAIKILVTSRPGGDALKCLGSFPTLAITEADTAGDIRALIRERLWSLCRLRHPESAVILSIERFLHENARGMFLWVVMIMEELERRDERLSNEVITAKLSKIPLSIAETYEAILQGTLPTRQKDMWMIIRWLLFTSRSPTIAELEKGLCLELGASDWFGFAGDLDFLCGSLIRLDGQREGVVFAHQTVRSFLQAFTANSNLEDVAGVNMNPIAANEQLATVCLQYLLQDEGFVGLEGLLTSIMEHSDYLEIMEGFLRQNPFLRYAIESWTFHVRATITPSPGIVAMLRQLLMSERRMQGVMILHYFINKHGSWGVPQTTTPLHTAAYFNLHWLLEIHPDEYRVWLNEPADMGDTALVWASEMGSTEMVKKLLEMGADPNQNEYDGWSALHWAARNGHVQVAVLLLSYGAHLNQRDSKGHTPLDWALDRGFWDVVDILRQRTGPNGPAGLNNRLRHQDHMGADGTTREMQKTWQLWDDRP